MVRDRLREVGLSVKIGRRERDQIRDQSETKSDTKSETKSDTKANGATAATSKQFRFRYEGGRLGFREQVLRQLVEFVRQDQDFDRQVQRLSSNRDRLYAAG